MDEDCDAESEEVLHRGGEEGLEIRLEDDDNVDESRNCCLRVSWSVIFVVEVGNDAEMEEEKVDDCRRLREKFGCLGCNVFNKPFD